VVDERVFTVRDGIEIVLDEHGYHLFAGGGWGYEGEDVTREDLVKLRDTITELLEEEE